ncbi:MAG: hypothetical protein NW226_24295 [Microscillaceae bacterium]|nr:hypothetical protein [Microscillaceae bacterium]
MTHQLPDFQKLALQYAQAQNDAERQQINAQAMQLMENYILQGTADEQTQRIRDLYALMQKDLSWLQELIHQEIDSNSPKL